MSDERKENLVQKAQDSSGEGQKPCAKSTRFERNPETSINVLNIPETLEGMKKIMLAYMRDSATRPNLFSLYICIARNRFFNGNLRRCNQWVEECFGIEDYSLRSNYNRVGDMLLMLQDTPFFTQIMQLDFRKTRALSGFKDKERLTAFLERCPKIAEMHPDKVWEAVTATLGTARAKKSKPEGYEQPDLFNMNAFRYLEEDDQHIYDAASKLRAKQAYDVIVGGMLYMDCGLISWKNHHGPMPKTDKRDLLEKMEYLINLLRDTPEA